MKIIKDSMILVFISIGFIVAIISWFTLDITSWIDLSLKNIPTQDRYEQLTQFVDVAVKVFATLLIMGICYYIVRRRAAPRRFTYEELADEVLKFRNNPIKMELIGYSLGFANPIKFRLQDSPWIELNVTIYTMCSEAITKNFQEHKSLDHRVEVISERRGEWRALSDQKRIGTLQEVEVSELIPFAAIVIGDERLFVSNYKWTVESRRLSLRKVSASQRLFFEISNVDGAFETVMAVIKTYRRHVG